MSPWPPYHTRPRPGIYISSLSTTVKLLQGLNKLLDLLKLSTCLTFYCRLENCRPTGSFFYLPWRAAAFGCIVGVLRAQQWGPSGPVEIVENPFAKICLNFFCRNPFGNFCGNAFEFFFDILLDNFEDIFFGKIFFLKFFLRNICGGNIFLGKFVWGHFFGQVWESS